MALSVVGTTAVANTNAISNPSGTQQNDVLYAVVGWATPTGPPTGWTQIGPQLTQGSGPMVVTVFRRVLGSSEPASWSIPNVAGGNVDCIAIRGANTTTPEDGTANAQGNSSTATAAAVTTTGSSDFWLTLWSVFNSGADVGTPSGWTSDCFDTAGSAILHKPLTASGTTGTQAFTLASSEDYVVFSIAVQPASGGSVNGSATLRGTGGAIDGFGGVGNLLPASAATPSVGMVGSGALPGTQYTNLFTGPQSDAETSTSGYYTTGGVTAAIDNTQFFQGSHSAKVTTDGGSTYQTFGCYAPISTFLPGQVYTVSGWVYTAASGVKLRIYAQGDDGFATNSSIGPVVSHTLPQGVWTRYSATFTMTAGRFQHQLGIRFDTGSPAQAVTFWVDALQCVVGADPMPWIEGGTQGTVSGIAGSGSVNASSAATPSLTFTGMGALMANLFGGQGIIAATGSLAGAAIHGAATLLGMGAIFDGLSGSGGLSASPAASTPATFTGTGGFLSGFGGQGIIPAVAGTLGGAVHGAANLLGMGAMLLGFGGHGDIQANSAATPTQTLEGSGSLGGGLAGSGSVSPKSAATPGITFEGTGAVGTGQAGSGSLAGSPAATPGITFQGMGALLAGLFSGRGILPSPSSSIGGLIVGVFRWLYTAAYNVLQQGFAPRNVLGLGFGNGYDVLQQTFAPRQVQTMVFGGTVYFTMSFVREPDVMVTPNSTIQVVMTAKKYDGTLMSNLTTVTCTVTFPDGSTSAFALGSGITNTGSGTYTLTYQTKMAGENIEDWVGTDASGNTAEFHNITPVSF